MPKRVIDAWRKGKGEYSLHKLDSELILAMEFDEAGHYVATGEIPVDKWIALNPRENQLQNGA